MTKLKKIITNQYFILILLTLLALFIRLLNIDKPYGFWYDEMLTYIFSSKSFPFGIINALLREDFHMPLYYMFVHGWMKLFGTSDVILRCSSVFWGVLSIPSMFYLGKEYKSEKLGYFLAVIACLSPLMILYSQELRFYSMLIFFSTVSLIFFLKLIEDMRWKYMLLFMFSNLVILYIYTMGIIFVGIEFLLLFVHTFLYKKEDLKKIILASVIFLISIIPYLILLLGYMQASRNSLISPFGWAKSTPYSMLFLLNDWFSLFLAGQYSQDPTIYSNLLNFDSNFFILIFMSIPVICFVTGFVSSLVKFHQKLMYLLLIALVFLGYEIFLCSQNSFVLMTKYTLIIFPIILLTAVDGLLLIKSEILKKICIITVLALFIGNSVEYKIMPSFRMRYGGYNFVAQELNKLNISSDDYILYPNRTELLRKYVINGKMIDFDIPKILYLDKTKQEELKVFDKNFVLTTNIHNSSDKLIPYLLSSKPTKELTNFEQDAIAQIPKGKKLIYVDDWQAFGNKTITKGIVNSYKNNKINKNAYNDWIFYLVYGKIDSDLKELLNNDVELKKISHKQLKQWHIYVYEKTQ